MKYGFELHVIHIAGTRMIEQRMDGLLRGVMTKGSVIGTPIKSFIPLHLTALERSNTLKDWIKSWMGQNL